LLVANREILNVARPQAKLRIRLSIDLKHTTELVELCQIARLKINRQRRKHLIDGDAQRLRLDTIDFDPQLRRDRAERS